MSKKWNAYMRQWRAKNREKDREYRREYMRRYRAVNKSGCKDVVNNACHKE